MKIALIPVYVDYYEKLIPGLQKSKERLVRQVRDAIPDEHQIIDFPKVTDRDSARKTARILRKEQADCAIILPLVAAFSALTDELVKGWKKPLILFSSMAGTRPPRPLTMTRVVGESQAFGSQAIANGWMRLGVKFHALHQIPGTPEGDAALERVLSSIDAATRLCHLRIGAIGGAFAGMTDIALPAKQFEQWTGSKIVPVPMTHIHRIMKSAATSQLRKIEKQIARTFRLGRFSPEEKDYSLRAALAIQEIVRVERLDCAAFNSHAPGGLTDRKLGLMCALGVALATSAGNPISEVGDLCTAFALWLGRRLSGASFYTELDSAYIEPRAWLLLNSGEHDLAWVRPGFKPRLVRNTNFVGVNGRGASVCAPLRTGPATIINFTPTPYEEKPYRILFCEGEIDRDWRPEMGVGNASFEVAGDARRTYEHWLSAGPVHHSATCPGHLGAQLRLFCDLRQWSCQEVS